MRGGIVEGLQTTRPDAGAYPYDMTPDLKMPVADTQVILLLRDLLSEMRKIRYYCEIRLGNNPLRDPGPTTK